MTPRRAGAVLIPFAGYREARVARDFLAGTLEKAGWVRAVKTVRAVTGERFLVVVVEPPLTVMRRRVLPTAVNGLTVKVEEE